MKRNIFSVTIAGLLISFSALKGQAQDKYNQAILWKVWKTDSLKPSYILGSCHILDTSRIFFPIDSLRMLVDQVRNICIEVEGATNDASVRKFIVHVYAGDTAPSLKTALGKQYYRQLKKLLKRQGARIPGFILKKINPLFLYYHISIQDLVQGKSGNLFSMDLYYELYAKSRAYTVHSVETVDEQIKMLYPPEIGYDSAIVMLKEEIDSVQHGRPSQIFSYYVSQHIPWDSTDWDTSHQDLLSMRNIKMANKVDTMMDIMPVFVIFGAAHLPFEGGVLDLLVKKGYTVVPMKISMRWK